MRSVKYMYLCCISVYLQSFMFLCLSSTAVAPPVASVPVLTSLQSSPALGPWLSELHVSASHLDPRRIAPSFLTHGLELSDLQEALEQLRVLAHSYHNENSGIFQSSSDEDDNDY